MGTFFITVVFWFFFLLFEWLSLGCHPEDGVWPQTPMMQMWLFSLEFPECIFAVKRPPLGFGDTAWGLQLEPANAIVICLYFSIIEDDNNIAAADGDDDHDGGGDGDGGGGGDDDEEDEDDDNDDDVGGAAADDDDDGGDDDDDDEDDDYDDDQDDEWIYFLRERKLRGREQ